MSSRKNKRRQAWLALGTLMSYAAAASGRPAIVYAQPNQQAALRRFDIAAGPLDAALTKFGRVSGFSIKYTIPAETVPGFRSPGVTGFYTGEQALKALLAGTGLSFSLDGAATAIIGLKNSESVSVTASQSDNVGLATLPGPLLDTPQSVTTISKETMQQQGTTTLRDALRNAPGISLAAGEGGAQGDNLTIRGFTARNDIFLDGMRDFGSYYRDPFDYNQVDVLEGPAGVEFGRGSTGGVINQETKQPLPRPLVTLQGDLGTDLTRRFTADINEPLPHGTALRLNLMADGGNVAERDVVENRRYGIAPTLAFGLNTPTRLTLDYFHLSEDDIPDYGLPWYFNRPAPVARHNYYGFRRGNYLRTDVNIGTAKLEHDLGGWALLRDQFRDANYVRHARITEPQLNTATSGAITPETPLSEIQVNRNQIVADSTETFLWNQADAMITGKLFGLRHTAVAGIEGGRETSDPVRDTFYRKVNGVSLNTVPTTGLLHPDENQPFSGTSVPSSNVRTASLSVGLYVVDTVELSPKWQVMGGARWDRFGTDYSQYVPPASSFHRVDEKPTWRGALVYKPRPDGSVYFDYGTSFNPSAETLALSQGTANLPPEENQTFEIGSKWDINRLSLRGSLFRTDKENAREVSPTNSLLYVLAGSQRVDGAELEAQGHVNERWDLLASYTCMHSEVVKSEFYPASVGRELANVPPNLFNVWTEYRLPHGFEVGGGGNFVDARTASSTVPDDPVTELPKEAPGYWVFNAMGKYELSERVSLQANVFNPLNRNYIDQIHPAHVVPGAGASVLFGVEFKF